MGSPFKWADETDVIIVGYGGAGAVAAIAAQDAGAKVIILEKQPADTLTQVRHTPNTRMSGGAWFCPSDKEKSATYLEGMAKVANESINPERQSMLASFSNLLVENTRWMRSIGVETNTAEEIKPILRSVKVENPVWTHDGGIVIPDFPELKGSESACLYFPKAVGTYTHGAALFKQLAKLVTQRGITVLWETPGEHLVLENGQVQGVIVHQDGKLVAIRANRAVVLACGGFEFNEWMKENYLRVYPAFFIGNPANTGDGINMALEVGAALWHMNCAS